MTQDDKIVQPEASSEGEASSESTETQQQPSVEEQVAKIMEGQMETFVRKFQSLGDKTVARIQREAESTARITEDAMAALDATTGEETEVARPKPRARDQYHSQIEMRRQQEAAIKTTVDAFESNIRQHITDLGIDPDDKGIDWGDSNNLSLTERQGKILASVSKIQKENAKLAEQKAEDRFKELEANLRKELELDNVDTTTSAGVGGGSDAKFIEGIGDGSIALDNKANLERAKKLGLM